MGDPDDDVARLIQSVLAELGWAADAAKVARRVQRLDIGLPVEDEFSVVCGWLGNCRLLHKLDQQQIPLQSRATYQVPDLLAFFSTQNSQRPVLIEVKSSTKRTLSFTEAYIQRLEAYADLLGFPLLIAWKFHSVWMLFEARHMKKAVKNFNIRFGKAMAENLLGALAGDVAYKVGAGVGVHFSMRKQELISSHAEDSVQTDEWLMVVDEVSFTDGDGEKRTDLDGEVQALVATWDLEEKQEHNTTHVKWSFVAGSEGMQFAHVALVRLLHWELPSDDKPNWRKLLGVESASRSIDDFSSALKAALKEKIVSHIFHILPQTPPDFITDTIVR
ncbi:restriction endonuclease [Aminobacter sp. NyZ550]|uniref:restriction endonuclease n=1 Tax=Aminobacter TaxID=31988 RepID=UPI0021D5EBA9|nr:MULTISPECIES: restriction endonuclease [Aminobacter]MDR7222262.1 Holliday junction resolvase [Aminobacter aminovorans]WAX96894.1 restriction endonuclease [Aminobacter sp. NyZ550]WMC96090.1 restriction endonuclease [Aminobacter aminovorans]